MPWEYEPDPERNIEDPRKKRSEPARAVLPVAQKNAHRQQGGHGKTQKDQQNLAGQTPFGHAPESKKKEDSDQAGQPGPRFPRRTWRHPVELHLGQNRNGNHQESKTTDPSPAVQGQKQRNENQSHKGSLDQIDQPENPSRSSSDFPNRRLRSW